MKYYVTFNFFMNVVNRRNNRLLQYDYSQNGAYFVTICAKDRKKIFWKENHILNVSPVGARIARPIQEEEPLFELSQYGLIVDEAINKINFCYNDVFVDKYVIMPNHIHIILRIDKQEQNGRAMRAPTISTVINQMKGYATKQIGHTIWQKLFHDHVIRNECDYIKIWEYIDNNPLKWELDCYYNE